jgi:hypothetical protein
MPDERRLIYWDADVVLSYIEEIPDRMAVLDALLDLSMRRDDPTKVVTSVLSVTEVAYAQAEKGAAALDPVVLARIDDFWADREAILLAEFHDLIAREARPDPERGRAWLEPQGERRGASGYREAPGRRRVPHLRQAARQVRRDRRLPDRPPADPSAADALAMSRYEHWKTLEAAPTGSLARTTSPDAHDGTAQRAAAAVV